jgi:nucleoside triphosphatase
MGLKKRIIVVGLVWNQNGELLFCKMPEDRGVFPGQWGFPGGGIEPNEMMEDGLRRELREELGIQVENIEPAFFKDGQYQKTFKDGSKELVYMIFLVFNCVPNTDRLVLNEEFDEYRWVREAEFRSLDLNTETIDTLRRIGKWP